MAKVRIRKAGPGETPGYYNKTAMYLKKAQEGMQVESEEQTAPTSQEEMMQAYYMYAYGQLVNDVDPDNVYNELVDKGLPEQVAVQMLEALMDRLVDEGEVDPDYKRNKQEQQEQEAADQEQQQPEQQEEPQVSQEEDYAMAAEDEDMANLEEGYTDDRSYMQDGGEQEEETDEVEYDDEEVPEEIIGQYETPGKQPEEVFDINKLIENTPGAQQYAALPGLDEYVPDYQEIQWAPLEALEASSSEESDQSSEMKKGGQIKKRDFVKNVMSLLKKQEGGEGEGEADKKDPTLGKGNPFDTLTEDVQKHKNNFLNAIRSKATEVKTGEMYDMLKQSDNPALQQLGMKEDQSQQQPYQMGGMTGGEDPLFKFIGGGADGFQEDPDYYEADFLPEAQYGANVPKPSEIRGYIQGAIDNSKKKKPQTVVPKATIRYVPRYTTGPGSVFNTLLPWNPIFGRKYMFQSNPYMLGTGTPYMDPLTGMKPLERRVTKRGILGRPKQWTDIYSVDAPSKMPNMDMSVFNTALKGNTYVNPNGALPMNFRSDTSGLKASTRRAIRQGENEMERNQRRIMRKVKNDPNYLMTPEGDITNFADPEMFKRYNETKDYEGGMDPARYTQEYYDNKPKDFDNLSDEEYFKKYGVSKKDDILESPANYEGLGRKINKYPRQEFTGTLINTSGPRVTEEDIQMAYGGYIPKANNGLTINNPNLPQPSPANPDLAVGNQAGMLAMQPQQQAWSTLNPSVPQQQANQPLSLPTKSAKDVSQQLMMDSRKKLEGEANMDKNKQLVGIDYKKKRRNVDTEAGVNIFNAGVRGFTGILNRADQNARERQMYDEFNSDGNYASQATKHRGDWVDLGSQMGQFRFDQMGQDRSGFSSYGKYGGFMQDGGEMDYLPDADTIDYDTSLQYQPDYNEGDEVYMTDEDIKQFMAKGGQIEYL